MRRSWPWGSPLPPHGQDQFSCRFGPSDNRTCNAVRGLSRRRDGLAGDGHPHPRHTLVDELQLARRRARRRSPGRARTAPVDDGQRDLAAVREVFDLHAVPKGSLRCAAVSASGLARVPLAVRPVSSYQEARPHSASAGEVPRPAQASAISTGIRGLRIMSGGPYFNLEVFTRALGARAICLRVCSAMAIFRDFVMASVEYWPHCRYGILRWRRNGAGADRMTAGDAARPEVAWPVEGLHAAIIAASKDPIYFCTPDYIIREANDPYVSIGGLTREEAIGRTVQEVAGPGAFRAAPPILRRRCPGALRCCRTG